MFISKRLFLSRDFLIWRQTFKRWGFCIGFDDDSELVLKLRSVTGHIYAYSDYELELFLKITFLSKLSWYNLPESYGDP